MNTIERFSQDPRGRCFPRPARPDEKIGVSEAILLDRIFERACDVRLPDNIVERLGPVFAGKNLVAHPKTLAFMASRERRNSVKIAFMKSILRLVALVLFPVVMPAQSPTPSERESKFTDPLLDSLVGNWRAVRKLADGKTAENVVRVGWVLNHQFLELHYLDVATPPQYEAMAFIGYDPKTSRYVLHWIDIFGGRASQVVGYGPLDDAAHSIYFTFNKPEGQFMNVYVFDPATKTWTSVMRQKTKGPWSVIAQDKFTPLAPKS